MTKRKAFTLIESLAVVSIIGILATIVFYGIEGYQRTSRDTKRKSDLFAISQGFEARALDQTCSDRSQVGKYPNITSLPDATTRWQSTVLLNTDSESGCNGTFTGGATPYLSLIPKDPSTGYAYYFNLNATATHYRLAASLEKGSAASCSADATESDRWKTISGNAYDCPVANTDFGVGHRAYDYYIGK